MNKNFDPCDLSSLLYNEVFDPDRSIRKNTDNSSFRLEEFGISATEMLTKDVLLKLIAHDTNNSQDTRVYLCYSWKSATPSVIKETVVVQKARTYTPQYGHDDNYPESVIWKSINYQIFSSSEFSIRHPEIAALI